MNENRSELFNRLADFKNNESADKYQIVDYIQQSMLNNDYQIEEVNIKKPWGAYIRFDDNDADKFVEDFFPDVNSAEIRLGRDDAKISPKILVVSPEQRLSWQYHNRRAEKWMFITDGQIERSLSDTEGDVIEVHSGEAVQFDNQERHRLIGRNVMHVIVAEIWQHTNADNLSDEDDIIRLADDYSR